jgi:hypothetical protein
MADFKSSGTVPSLVDDEIKRINAEISRFKRDVVSAPRSVAPVEVVSTVKIEKAVESEVKAVERSLSGRQLSSSLLFMLSLLACVSVLAYLFGSLDTFVFYSAFGLFLWWWSHRFHRAKSHPLKSFIALGAIVVFLYLFYLLFDDALSMLVCVVYALSFVIAGILFFYHTRRQLPEEIHSSFPKTFFVVLGSHLAAFAAAALVAYLLPSVMFADSFVSVTFLLLAWLFPCLFIYFFINKFLYLRFFDRVHIWRDFLKGLAHGLGYAVVFIIMIELAYLLTAMQLAGTERSGYDDGFSRSFTKLQNVKYGIETAALGDATPELMGLKVAQDVVAMSEDAFVSAAVVKAGISKSYFSISDYASDNYFTMLARNRRYVGGVWLNATGIDEVKSDLLREYSRMKAQQAQGVFDDGTRSMEEHYVALVSRVGDTRVRYAEPQDVAFIREKTVHPDSYVSVMGDGELLGFLVATYPELEVLYPGESRFSARVFDSVYHTVVVRDLLIFLFESSAMDVREVLYPSTLQRLYAAGPDETLVSKVLRYRILRSNQEALLAASSGKAGFA